MEYYFLREICFLLPRQQFELKYLFIFTLTLRSDLDFFFFNQ